jgi:hypothetical protein
MRFNPARFPLTHVVQFACSVAAMAGAIRNAAPALQVAGVSVHNAAPPGAAMV